jgi:hypothetical protein
MMIAKVIALSLIPAGAAALGVVSYIQHKPGAFTTETHAIVAEPVVRPIAPSSPAVIPDDEPETVVLAPLVVAKPSPVKQRVQKRIKSKVPCSSWRALGYEHVDQGSATGVSKVRELCDPDTAQD